MDKVERLVRTIRPFTLDIVDVEHAVRWYYARLYRAEVCSDNKGTREFIREIDRPDACTGGKI
jgi:hypothetical protein